ncbi:MAG: 3'-5' exonuclease [Bacteroidetes bacterium RIFOXYA12_FULL_35_11]|nr:MAG: 3'-5' exonuclease [Bacteroidetes bacterium GWF2_35_48]OFY82731.1 MAG: 3'-5' exonuclease [Bacteroidetes bacterium RIFOXYA12_FULL_35_11]OFY95292.1 MAG: 3'-5' exonuclease [Bacteroidetes bacterium RIFOXYB2_FULL_35_7]OFY96977.1 MAG: 3'-5' exonuclease [Bacteroidetes bacterium RIFOXYC12_FULL_35_7]HBX52311.1 3'-5' exonuclease [Bacteroidales bacterium]
MLEQYKTENIIFLDIETAPQHADFNSHLPRMQELWIKKADTLKIVGEGQSAADKEIFYRTSIYAEFGKIICISVGLITEKNNNKIIRIKSFAGDDERKLLLDFSEMIKKLIPATLLCAHNGKEFDFPYISRRMIIHGIPLPKLLDLSGKKPWEVNHLDTMELWKFGDYKSYTSLNLLTAILNIPTPKDDIDGGDVACVYWEEKDLERIVTYCQKDVLAVAQIFLKLRGEALLDENNIEIAG